MATQIDSSSPFTGSAGGNQKAPETPEEFSIRTMQDDLLALQKKSEQPQQPAAIADKPKPPVKIPEKIESFVAEPPKKQEAPKAEVGNIIRPSVEKISVPKPEFFGEEPLYIKPSLDKKPAPKKTGDVAYKITLTVLVALILAVIGLGGYYFWTTRSTKQANQQPPVETPQQPETPVVVPPVEKYSQGKPNFLPLDLATLFPEDIKKSINDITPDLDAKSSQMPYEFIAVDPSNNPVAFSVFAAAAKLNLSADIMNDLDNAFSIYLFNDNAAGTFRFAVAIDIAKKDTLLTALAKQEKTFITDADFLFLDTKPETAIGNFKSSFYDSNSVRYTIRFVNFTNQQPLSIDYAIINNRLVIATSRYTMHAVLDKLAAEQAASAQSDQPVQQTATDSAMQNNADTATTDSNTATPTNSSL